jgi:hypothetical protein
MIILLLDGGLAFAQEPPIYVNNLSVEAGQAMERIAGRDPSDIKSEAELVEWARARLAWVSLRRLQGREKEALSIFEGCARICEKYGAEKEWAAAQAWGCQKKREAKPCLSSSSIPSDKKTKAQKPSR